MKSEITAELIRREKRSLPQRPPRCAACLWPSSPIYLFIYFLTNFWLLYSVLNRWPVRAGRSVFWLRFLPKTENAFASCTYTGCLYCSCRSDLEKLVHVVGVSSRRSFTSLVKKEKGWNWKEGKKLRGVCECSHWDVWVVPLKYATP